MIDGIVDCFILIGQRPKAFLVVFLIASIAAIGYLIWG